MSPASFYSPHGLAISCRDDIYIADTGNCRVQIFSSEGLGIALGVSTAEGDAIHHRDPSGTGDPNRQRSDDRTKLRCAGNFSRGHLAALGYCRDKPELDVRLRLRQRIDPCFRSARMLAAGVYGKE